MLLVLHALSGLAPENYLCKIIFFGTVRCAPQRRSDTVSRLVHSLSLKCFSRAFQSEAARSRIPSESCPNNGSERLLNDLHNLSSTHLWQPHNHHAWANWRPANEDSLEDCLVQCSSLEAALLSSSLAPVLHMSALVRRGAMADARLGLA